MGGLILLACYFIILVCLPWLVYAIIKKNITGLVVCIAVLIVPVLLVAEYHYHQYKKLNAIPKDLNQMGFTLSESFTFKSQANSERSDILGPYKTVKIIISEEDTSKIIQQIQNAKNIQGNHYKTCNRNR